MSDSPPDPYADDRRLARRLLQGDEREFNAFFDSHFQRLYRFALARLGGDADAAEEIAQATLCKAIVALGSFRGEAALFTWLCTFCRHEIGDYYRRRRRAPPTLDLLEDSPEIRAALAALSEGAGTGPEDDLRRKEIARLVHATLDDLPAAHGDALEWKYILGLSVDEIAARMGTTSKAAESLLSRARRSFRDRFESVTRPRPGQTARTADTEEGTGS